MHQRFQEPCEHSIDIPTPIETLFDQLLESRDFSVQGDEIISDFTLVRLGYNNILQTGVFNSDCNNVVKRKQLTNM